jgi:hypothetical protein
VNPIHKEKNKEMKLHTHYIHYIEEKRRKLKRGKFTSEILEGLRKSLVDHKKVKERNKESEGRWRKREPREKKNPGGSTLKP